MSPDPTSPARRSPAADAPATRSARAVVRGLVAQGVREVVLCPGSRSAPLAYALLAAHDAGWLRLHVRADERSAGFVALGLTRGGPPDGPRPAAVVTTSGTAVANLHPAVLEAAHAGRPLVVVTADRPHEVRGTGANQTTDQQGRIFGAAVRWSADLPAGQVVAGDAAVESLVARAVAAARGARTADPGPVHLNVGLREPLTPVSTWAPGAVPAPRPAVEGHVGASAGPAAATPLRRGPRTVVVAGDGAGVAARELAESAGWPLLAEPTSGARCGPNAVGPGSLLLDVPDLAAAVERVVVLGHPTLSRPVSRLLARTDVDVVVVAPTGAVWTDVAGTAAQVCVAVRPDGPAGPGEEAWRERWAAADAAARDALDAHLARAGLVGPVLAREVAEATRLGSGGARTLVVGASAAIRDLDLAGVPAPTAPGATVLANRGLAGIDGTLSTAAGVSLARKEPVRALVGDLTFLHDVGGLAVGTLEAVPDLQVVVADDDGGGIFATLEYGAPEQAAAFERLFATPHGTDLGAIAAGYGARVRRVDDLAGLRSALAEPVRGLGVVHVRVDRAHRRQRHADLAAAVHDAVRAVAHRGPSGAGPPGTSRPPR